jgi:hypothetical protein
MPGAGYMCPAVMGMQTMVSTGAALQSAMMGAKAGDVIVVASGMYQGQFQGTAAGTASAPIVVMGQDPTNPPVLSGASSTEALYINGGSYWQIQNLVVTGGLRGILFDNTQSSYVCGVEVHGTGQEAIHMRSASSNNLVEGVYVHDTGQSAAGFGEAFYCGSASGYPPASNNNTIKNSLLGPNIGSKYVNFQPGAAGNVVDSCEFDGTGAKGANAGYSFVSLKGDPSKPSVVTNSTFRRNGNSVLTSAIAVSFSAADVHGNTFDLDDPTSATCFRVFSGGSLMPAPQGDTRVPTSSTDVCP